MKTVQEVIKIYHQEIPLHLSYTYPENSQGTLPTILILPAWGGQDMFCQHKASLMAQKGYRAVVADMYGYARTGHDPQECSDLIAPFINDRAFLRERLRLIIKSLQKDPQVDKENIIAIGYCFGGMCVLDAVRNNLGLKGGVSIHGLYVKPSYALFPPYTAKVLALHGYRDPMNTPAQLMDFQAELGQACEDWQLISFGKGFHAFTNPEAIDTEHGRIYDSVLDKRTTKYVDLFVEEMFSL